MMPFARAPCTRGEWCPERGPEGAESKGIPVGPTLEARGFAHGGPDGPPRQGECPERSIVYILRCADGTLNTGSTNDVQSRLQTHNSGRGAKYTASRGPVEVVYAEEHESRSAAQKREAQLKGWTRAKKEALVASNRACLRRTCAWLAHPAR